MMGQRGVLQRRSGGGRKKRHLEESAFVIERSFCERGATKGRESLWS